MVIRNEKGDIMGACCRLTNWVASAFAAEAQAVIHGLRFAQDLGLHSVILEGDAKSVIRKINGHEEDYSVISAFTCDAKEIANSFQFCKFQWVDRTANQVAHVLA